MGDDAGRWVFVAVNAETAQDPVEVIYQLTLIDPSGTVVKRDGFITGCEHGAFRRLSDAISNGVYVLEQDKTPVPPERVVKAFPCRTSFP